MLFDLYGMMVVACRGKNHKTPCNVSYTKVVSDLSYCIARSKRAGMVSNQCFGVTLCCTICMTCSHTVVVEQLSSYFYGAV